jgi:putative sigma-54 modulation protein
MSIVINMRHMDSDDKLHQYVERKAEELTESFERIENIHIILKFEKHWYTSEVVVQGRQHMRMEAAETADKVLVAVDASFNKMEKQLRKLTEKVKDHKAAMKFVEGKK